MSTNKDLNLTEASMVHFDESCWHIGRRGYLIEESVLFQKLDFKLIYVLRLLSAKYRVNKQFVGPKNLSQEWKRVIFIGEEMPHFTPNALA